jgi:hypothetical protein
VSEGALDDLRLQAELAFARAERAEHTELAALRAELDKARRDLALVREQFEGSIQREMQGVVRIAALEKQLEAAERQADGWRMLAEMPVTSPPRGAS